jgi:hypothetical protein
LVKSASHPYDPNCQRAKAECTLCIVLDFFTENESFFTEELILHIKTVGMLNIHQQSKGILAGTLNDVQISFFKTKAKTLMSYFKQP